MARSELRSPQPFVITIENMQTLSAGLQALFAPARANETEPDDLFRELAEELQRIGAFNYVVPLSSYDLSQTDLGGPVFSQEISTVDFIEGQQDNVLNIGGIFAFDPMAWDSPLNYYGEDRRNALATKLEQLGLVATPYENHGQFSMRIDRPGQTLVGINLGAESAEAKRRSLQANVKSAHQSVHQIDRFQQERDAGFINRSVRFEYNISNVALADERRLQAIIREAALVQGKVYQALLEEAGQPFPQEPIIWR